MQLHIRHETQYSYTEPVKRSVQNLRLTPRQETSQRTLQWNIAAPGKQHAQLDAHGNVVHLLTIDQPHREIRIVVNGIIETDDQCDAHVYDQGNLSPLAYLAATTLTRADDSIVTFAGKHIFDANHATRFLDLATDICERIEYVTGSTDVHESAAQAFARRKGVCQDHAHVFIACCRSRGIPARYVSGYFYVGKDNEVASHAWVDVWCADERSWLGVDVTHRTLIGKNHCRLAVGRDYLEACPIRGVRRGGGEEAMKVAVSIKETQQ